MGLRKNLTFYGLAAMASNIKKAAKFLLLYGLPDPATTGYMSAARQAIDEIMKTVQEKCDAQIILNNQKVIKKSKPMENKGMVGDTRFELVTSSMSTKRSTPELIAPQ